MVPPLPKLAVEAHAPVDPRDMRAERLPLIDAVKGLACLAIVGHHFALYGPLSEEAQVLAPAIFDWFVRDGRLAVQVFLVLGGFLAAASLAPDGLLRRGGNALERIAQRYLRLVMPYLVALMASLLVAGVARPWLDDELVPGAPGLLQLVAHGLLLQDLLGQDALSAGVWYVAVDFQLFTLALFVFWIADRSHHRSRDRFGGDDTRSRWISLSLVLAGTALSLALFNRLARFDVTAFYFFGAYGLGMLAFWLGRVRRTALWRLDVALLAAIGLAALVLDWRSRIAIALVTALALAALQRAGALQKVPQRGVRWVMWLGRVSYSLFLIHFPVLLLVSAISVRLWPVEPLQPLGGLAGLGLAFALAIGAAALMHHWIEQRHATWRVWLVLSAGLLLCGAIGDMLSS